RLDQVRHCPANSIDVDGLATIYGGGTIAFLDLHFIGNEFGKLSKGLTTTVSEDRQRSAHHGFVGGNCHCPASGYRGVKWIATLSARHRRHLVDADTEGTRTRP
ncbi:MAG: hypothetical protein WBG36_07185, partial [Ornithinimicrobium sp.]